jgi:hypothetical protein
MTETEWLASADPEAMLALLKGRVSERKLRLFCCACCRRVLHLYHDERSRTTVEIIESYVEGRATAEGMSSAYNAAQDVLNEMVGKVWDNYSIVSEAGCTARNAAGRKPEKAARETVLRAAAALAAESVGPFPISTPGLVHHRTWRMKHQEAWHAACRELCAMLRDVVGNPFHAPEVSSYCLAWNDATVPRIAQAIYEERAFERLPILADALEDAGCDAANIIAHCRSDSPHVRGCWVVDLLTGKAGESAA